jgi:hypothetical protein
VKYWKKDTWHPDTKITQEYLFLYKMRQILHKKISQKRCKSHYILIKGTTQQEDITVLNIYTLNIHTPNFIKQTLLSLKEQIEPDTMLGKDFNSQLSSTEHRTKINQDFLELNSSVDDIDAGIVFQFMGDYTFFSASHGSFSKIVTS